MAKVISVINLKGGVAKTTTTVQLAECLAANFSMRVLVVDLDPQTNATIALIGEEKWESLDENKQTLFHLFNDKLQKTSEFKIEEAIQSCVSNLSLVTLSMLASSIRLINIQDRLGSVADNTHHQLSPMEVLKLEIEPLLDKYDYVFIDCPPNLGFITKNGIEISDYYLIPTIPDRLSTFGIPEIFNQISEVSHYRNLKIKCLGLVVTKFVSNSSVHRRTMDDLPLMVEKYSQRLEMQTPKIFNTIMPQANATSEAMDYTKKFSTFAQKYGYTLAGGEPLHSYVANLTKEFISYVEN